MKHATTFFRNIATESELNHYIILRVHWGETDQPNMIEMVKYFKVGNHARLQIFRGKNDLYCCEKNSKKLKDYANNNWYNKTAPLSLYLSC